MSFSFDVEFVKIASRCYVRTIVLTPLACEHMVALTRRTWRLPEVTSEVPDNNADTFHIPSIAISLKPSVALNCAETLPCGYALTDRGSKLHSELLQYGDGEPLGEFVRSGLQTKQCYAVPNILCAQRRSYIKDQNEERESKWNNQKRAHCTLSQLDADCGQLVENLLQHAHQYGFGPLQSLLTCEEHDSDYSRGSILPTVLWALRRCYKVSQKQLLHVHKSMAQHATQFYVCDSLSQMASTIVDVLYKQRTKWNQNRTEGRCAVCNNSSRTRRSRHLKLYSYGSEDSKAVRNTLADYYDDQSSTTTSEILNWLYGAVHFIDITSPIQRFLFKSVRNDLYGDPNTLRTPKLIETVEWMNKHFLYFSHHALRGWNVSQICNSIGDWHNPIWDSKAVALLVPYLIECAGERKRREVMPTNT